MGRSSDCYHRQHGWDTTSHDYHCHLSRMERTPSVLTDVPQYPNVHMIFNNKAKVVAYEEEKGHYQHHQKQQEPAVESHKKVNFVEETIETEKNGSKSEICKKSVDEEADGFIQQTHKNFELCKWATFKS